MSNVAVRYGAAQQENISVGGNGSAGIAANYEELANLPQIESVTLIGNKSFSDLGLEAITAATIDAICI